ncbi:c-type cytochrome [Aurantibacter sp.]|uniref:c-type cytochrome n=1 Tax=Aurantibacter sp. TaxID=2807103 RepID=UPI0032651EA9
MDVWAFRSVLDKKPRMLTIALDSQMYVAYDLSQSILYKAWKGGIAMEGAPYTSKKNIQPTSWGTAYISDSIKQQQWVVLRNGIKEFPKVNNRGYSFRKNQIYLQYTLILSKGDSILIKERPEYVRDSEGKPGLERWFKTEDVPEGTTIFLEKGKESFELASNDTSVKKNYFEILPEQFEPDLKSSYDHLGRLWMEESDCFTCHQIEEPDVGPSFSQIAQRYPNNKNTFQELTKKVQLGGSGAWGENVMNPHPQYMDAEIEEMLEYILQLKKDEPEPFQPFVRDFTIDAKNSKIVPGNGAPLETVHPSYDLTTLHNDVLKPKVGGLAFLPDGRLLYTTWDTEGGVYILDGFQNGDSTQITNKRIATGLHEPLGIEVVDGSIYVLQKHELTKLIDHDGDEVIDEYKAICNTWQVTEDFHEFAFGLVYDKGYFYVSLSMAMRLLKSEKQKLDRGRTIKIGMDGSYVHLDYGLRTPNGIGLGVDGELFVTDNQGQWLPGNKLIHVKKGKYNGMAWGLLDTLQVVPKMNPPTLWLPGTEIANSPSEPVLMNDGPYKGQMLHGDVCHGGIKRDFIEKINGNYQGAVFRFTQGLAAGVNRLCWGPDGALYIGEVGMVGGWTWKETKYGLQSIKYNGKSTFEMLAVRAKPEGFEIEFTQPLKEDIKINPSTFYISQWWYKPTKNYGGPKMDLEQLKITSTALSKDRTKLYLELPGLKKEHVVYLRIPVDLQSDKNLKLWSTEAWYTLNTIPK